MNKLVTNNISCFFFHYILLFSPIYPLEHCFGNLITPMRFTLLHVMEILSTSSTIFLFVNFEYQLILACEVCNQWDKSILNVYHINEGIVVDHRAAGELDQITSGKFENSTITVQPPSICICISADSNNNELLCPVVCVY